jgi:hypothetical protein
MPRTATPRNAPDRVRHCENEHRGTETVLCRASEDWPDPYCIAFSTEAILGGRRDKEEFAIRFGDEGRDIGSVCSAAIGPKVVPSCVPSHCAVGRRTSDGRHPEAGDRHTRASARKTQDCRD